MRVVWAALLVAAALAAVLGGWFATGWRGVTGEAAALEAAPRAEAARRSALLAAELSARLEALRASEGQRPYYEYQNLFHDPRGASEGQSVVRSPLSRGPSDDLVAVQFQIAPDGRIGAPTINDEVPELSEPARLAVDQRALAALRPHAAELADLARPPALPRVADARAGSVPNVEPTAQEPSEPQAQQAQQAPILEPPEVQKLPPSAYAQNMAPNAVYREVQSQKGPRASARPPPATGEAGGPDPVAVEVGPLVWRTTAIEGAPALVALRSVATPDGRITQGLALSADEVAAWIDERAGDVGEHAALRPPGAPRAPAGSSAPVLLAGQEDSDDAGAAAAWRVEVDPGPALAEARTAGAALRRGFLFRFVPSALLALVCGALVVALVARADRLARERSDFAAAAAHELRTPLAGLVLYGDMLADGLGDPARSADYARRVSDEAQRLGRVVGNVLGFTQLERRGLAVSPRPGDAARAARDAADRIQPSYDHAGASLERDIPDAAPCRLEADAVARILQNLLDNAEKYSRGAAERAVTLSVRADADGAVIEVADRGPGVPASLQRLLFRPFARGVDGEPADRAALAAGPDRQARPAGLGLGLALAQAQARAMGGDLSYRDRDGGGSVFSLRLPPAGG